MTARIAEDFGQLSTLLDGEILGGFAIIDRTLWTGVGPGHRTIELRANSWNGHVLGTFAEYPLNPQYKLHFRPSGDVAYAVLFKVIDALESHGVAIDEPER